MARAAGLEAVSEPTGEGACAAWVAPSSGNTVWLSRPRLRYWSGKQVLKQLLVIAAPLLVAAVALSGCATSPSPKPPVREQALVLPQTPPGPLKAVELYIPRSSEEVLAQAALELADAEARKRIEQAMEAYEAIPVPLPEAERSVVEKALEQRRAAAQRYNEEVARGRKAYETFLGAYPQNWYARHRYAWFLTDEGLRFEAAEEWEKVIQLEPRFPYAYNNLGTLFNHMGRDAEAIQLYRKAIELKESDPDFHVNLAVNYSTHRQEAMELYGWTLPETFWKCIAEYRRALELSPQDVDIARDLASQFIMAKYFSVAGTADEALKAYDHYLSLNLEPIARMAALRDVGRIYLKEKNDPRSAIAWFEKALAMGEDAGAQSLMKQAQEALAKQGQPVP